MSWKWYRNMIQKYFQRQYSWEVFWASNLHAVLEKNPICSTDIVNWVCCLRFVEHMPHIINIIAALLNWCQRALINHLHSPIQQMRHPPFSMSNKTNQLILLLPWLHKKPFALRQNCAKTPFSLEEWYDQTPMRHLLIGRKNMRLCFDPITITECTL